MSGGHSALVYFVSLSAHCGEKFSGEFASKNLALKAQVTDSRFGQAHALILRSVRLAQKH